MNSHSRYAGKGQSEPRPPFSLPESPASAIMSVMKNVHIGTSGYSYKDWVGPVYPAGTRSRDFLPLYCRLFSFVELNFSYYRMPAPEQMERMAATAAASKPDFLFSVKAHQCLTHIREAGWREQAEEFRAGMAPLRERDQLGAVLLQFPYSFHYTRENRCYLDRLSALLEELPLAVELRNGAWQRESVYRAMQERNLSLVMQDLPALPGNPRRESRLTGDMAYIRLHGRNGQQWWTGDNVSRYDYLYSGEELAEWEGVIPDLAGKAKRIFIAFNNHHKGKAVQNARELQRGLGLPLPPGLTEGSSQGG